MPAQDRRECEEEQTDRNEDDSRAAEAFHECRLCERCAVLSCAHNACCEDGEYGQVQDDKCVDEHTDHCAESLVMRGFRFRSRVGMRGGSHAGLVGEEAAGNTVTDRLTHCDSCTCAENRLRVKRAFQNRKECCRKSRNVHADQDQAADDVDTCHDRNDLLNHRCQALCSSEEDHRRDDRNDNADDHR